MIIRKILLIQFLLSSTMFTSSFCSEERDYDDEIFASSNEKSLPGPDENSKMETLKSSVKTSRPNAHLFPSFDECEQRDLIVKIKGGKRAYLKDFRWLVPLEYRVDMHNLVTACAGSIITRKYVLTAAHCVHGEIEKNGPLVSFRVGVHYIRTNSRYCDRGQEGSLVCIDAPVRHYIVEKLIHDDYQLKDKRPINDIALLRTDRDIQYSPSVAPVCLPDAITSMQPLKDGELLTVAGWGRTGPYGPNSLYKLKVDVPYVENENCLRRHIDGQLCAGGKDGKDSCRGDSGSSLVRGWVIEGIVSFGPACGIRKPAIYTRVRNFTDWIYDKVKP